MQTSGKQNPLSFLLLMKIGFGVYLWGDWFLGTLCTNVEQPPRSAKESKASNRSASYPSCTAGVRGVGEKHTHTGLYMAQAWKAPLLLRLHLDQQLPAALAL